MKRRFALSFVALLAMGGGAIAHAQTTDAPQSWGAIQTYATCLVDQWPGVVQDVTAAFPDSEDYKRAVAMLGSSPCAGNVMQNVPSQLVRGSLYQALYAKNFADQMPAMTASALSVDEEVRDRPEDKAASYKALRQYGECVVRTDTPASRALTLSRAGSTDELQALSALQPTFARCLTAGGQITFSKAVLTGVIAEVLYRLSVPSWR